MIARWLFVITSCILLTDISLSASAGTVLNIRVLLEGAYIQETGLMRTNFAELPYKPASPYLYGNDPFTLYIMAEDIPEGVVDWIYIEFRTELDAKPVARTACFLRSDGRVIGGEGYLPVFDESALPAGNYYVVVSHRNHSAVMSARPVHISRYSEYYDFSLGEEMVWNAEQHPMKKLSRGVYSLRAGDLNGDGCKNPSDIAQWQTAGENDIYFRADVNLDGIIDSLDRILLLHEYPYAAPIPAVDNTDTPVITADGFMQQGFEIYWPLHTFDNYGVSCRPCRGQVVAEVYTVTKKLIYQQTFETPGGRVKFPPEIENGMYILKVRATGRDDSYSREIELYRPPEQK